MRTERLNIFATGLLVFIATLYGTAEAGAKHRGFRAWGCRPPGFERCPAPPGWHGDPCEWHLSYVRR